MNWRTMISAPKDGTTVMLWNGEKARYKIVTGRYNNTFGWQSAPGAWPCSPKAWAPMPDEPEGIQG